MTPAWFMEAACKGSTALFYPDPEKSGPYQLRLNNAAKKVCAGCPVREPCLDFALANNEKEGVWGGTTFHDRRRMRQPEGSPNLSPKPCVICGTTFRPYRWDCVTCSPECRTVRKRVFDAAYRAAHPKRKQVA